VSSYQVKRSTDWFVWAAPTLLRGTLDLFNEGNSLRGENTVADLNPARVKARGDEMHTNYDKFKLIVVRMSIEAHTTYPVQMITALNREGVELQFNQSYRFEVTTNPLGKHYITS
jgi:hypothetical protein